MILASSQQLEVVMLLLFLNCVSKWLSTKTTILAIGVGRLLRRDLVTTVVTARVRAHRERIQAFALLFG